MAALSARPDVELKRIDAQRNVVTGATLVALGRARGYGTWKHQPINRLLTDARVRRAVARNALDALVGVGDVEPSVSLPTFLYQDANFSVARGHYDLLREHAPALVRLPSGRLDALVERQRAAYASAEVVFSFSDWFARWLVEQDGVPMERVRVVGAGLHALPEPRDLSARGAGGTKVLFVGREFFRKGGELVVSALERLRASGSGEFTLTVVGPNKWPLATPIPSWVKLGGEMPAAEVRKLWADHDLFALPSWYEPFGLVFLEARAAGVPILARDAYCMPELVPEECGRLVPEDAGVDAVAERLLEMSQDSQLFASAAAAAEGTRTEWTWDSVADRVTGHIRAALTA